MIKTDNCVFEVNNVSEQNEFTIYQYQMHVKDNSYGFPIILNLSGELKVPTSTLPTWREQYGSVEEFAANMLCGSATEIMLQSDEED
jgi:hypothetical protein